MGSRGSALSSRVFSTCHPRAATVFSRPWSSKKALNGLMAAPVSRSITARTRVTNRILSGDIGKHSTVARVGLRQLGEFARCRPVKPARVNNRTPPSDCRDHADEFGGAVHHDIGPVFDEGVSGRAVCKRIVDYQRESGCGRYRIAFIFMQLQFGLPRALILQQRDTYFSAYCNRLNAFCCPGP